MLAAAAGWGVLSARPATAAFSGADGVIVISTTKIPAGAHCAGRHRGAQLVAIEPGAASILLTCLSGNAVHPFVSPDGTDVVFALDSGHGPTQLFTVPLPSTPGAHHRTPPSPASASPPLSDDDPSWSPAGDGTVVFQRWAPGAHIQLYAENVADPAGAHPVFSAPTGFDDTQPVFDPADAQLLAFVRRIGGHTHIFTYDLHTRALTDLPTGTGSTRRADDAKPDFSPDGAHIVFESDRVCRSMQIYVVSVHGGSASPVITPTRHGHHRAPRCATTEADPVYSPEGDAVFFDNASSRCPQVSVVPVGSGSLSTGPPHTVGTGDEPNWAPTPAADPPADAPETALPVALPILGAAMAGSGLWVRNRRARRAMPRTAERGESSR